MTWMKTRKVCKWKYCAMKAALLAPLLLPHHPLISIRPLNAWADVQQEQLPGLQLPQPPELVAVPG